ncbi:MAG: ABC transporter permease [Clostridia bacterium]|nr:ABC transporter permease [Clostridia bacterium]
MEAKTYENIPKEKFQFAKKGDLSHDTKLDTKPVSYFHDAFRRFCKNKGAVVAAIIIIFLILFALIAPFCTEYTVKYYDSQFTTTAPKCKLFANTSFWDGCVEEETDYIYFIEKYAIGKETGHLVVKNNKYEITDEGLYKYRKDTYYSVGFGNYKTITESEYKSIQKYQNETGRQVLYPTVRLKERPSVPFDRNANIYYKVKGNKTEPALDKDGELVLNYWTTTAGAGRYDDGYDSLRIEGDDGFTDENGKQTFYVYGRVVSGGYEVRAEYYEYYIYQHVVQEKDGITEPYFLFGTTAGGKDIFTCLASGARFSFLFAIAVAAVNMFVGAIYGAVSGYYGGKIDLIMERISDILNAVPFIIVITLLKLNMGSASNILILFIAFFLTGWIGMASTTRMQFYRYKNQEYVLAARTLGASDKRLMFKHIFPNALGTLVTSCALVIPSMIYSEVNLSYLGIINLEAGSITSVGTLITAGQSCLSSAPFVALFPSIFLALLMLSFNLFGNGLRDAFNPSLRGSEG